ncbi:hypothetical protein CK936_30220 [Streptomyces albireticuli]|uniref:Uncharacterized protein n=1 Tax=Streptomyces albireticuli TaxID=1940 RepID=A0A2A2D199_9ACTN|nr:hypothetical protein CK936_30220 [Streptomyces albireticuli]
MAASLDSPSPTSAQSSSEAASKVVLEGVSDALGGVTLFPLLPRGLAVVVSAAPHPPADLGFCVSGVDFPDTFRTSPAAAAPLRFEGAGFLAVDRLARLRQASEQNLLGRPPPGDSIAAPHASQAPGVPDVTAVVVARLALRRAVGRGAGKAAASAVNSAAAPSAAA